jgi:phenylacetate-CoA ligase
LGRFDALYNRLPIGAQHAAVTAYGLYWHWLRFGPGYKWHLSQYAQREQFENSEWQSWRQNASKNLLRDAATRVPFYMREWSSDVKAAAFLGRLEELPLLEKESIRTEPDSFLRQNKKPRRRLVFNTSGSTGTPIASIWTIQELRSSLALREVRSARWAGVSFKLPRATFSGRMVEPDPESKGPYYRFNAIERQVYFSAFHLRPDTAPLYVKALKKHRIEWMTGYSFSFYLLAIFILDQNLELPRLKAVITTSEKLTTEMREVMERAYRCRVYEEYSTVENAVFASECESGRLHVSPDAGIVEILRPDGKACAPGEVGEVVATCLSRTYQPFIRYRLGDMACWDGEPCPCGRAMPVLEEVSGRIEDAVIGTDGRRIVRFHGIFVEQPNVREGQIVQETLSRIRVRVVPVNGFSSTDVQDITQRVKQRLGSQVEVIVESVESIPRTKAGKFRAVISLVGQKTSDGDNPLKSGS